MSKYSYGHAFAQQEGSFLNDTLCSAVRMYFSLLTPHYYKID